VRRVRQSNDPISNRTVRREVSGAQPFTYTQAWTIDNCLASVVKSDVTGTMLATTTIGYDGDGVRVRKTDPSGTTLYVGDIEVLITGTTQVTTSYYAFGGAMVAMRSAAGGPLTYLHGDHLGSASLATNASGAKVSEQRYKPYGELRWSSAGAMPTDFGFTGQRTESSSYVGSLMDYVARSYSPALGRFVSADTIVPGAGNSQAYNRYMYVLGNPLGRVDPSGHCSGDRTDSKNRDAACWSALADVTSKLGYEPDLLHARDLDTIRQVLAWMWWGVSFMGDKWTGNNLVMAAATLQLVADRLFYKSPLFLMAAVGGPFAINKHTVATDGEIHADAGVNMWMPDTSTDVIKPMAYLAHEIGHRVDDTRGLSKSARWPSAEKYMIRETWESNGAGGWKLKESLNVATDQNTVSNYAMEKSGEDFAENFAYWVVGGAYGWVFPTGKLSSERKSAFWSFFP